MRVSGEPHLAAASPRPEEASMELFEYAGQTTEELLALEGKVSSVELVFAFERAIEQKFERAVGQKLSERPAWEAFVLQIRDVAEGRGERAVLSEEELIVPAIVWLEREVNNGGYHQLFRNFSAAYTPLFTTALRRIGREDIAVVTQAAIDSLKIEGPLTVEAIDQVLDLDNREQRAKLSECEDRFYAIAYPPAEDLLNVSLWNFIKANRDKIVVP